MRLAVFSDVHGNHLALEAVLKDIRARDVDQVFCLGDLVGYAPFPDKVIEIIRNEKIPTVLGNYDEGVGFNRLLCGCDFPDESARLEGEKSLAWTKFHTTEENKEFLRSLPRELWIENNGWKVQMVHGSPRALNEYLYEDTPDAVLKEIFDLTSANILLVGHTHKPFHRTFMGRHLINVGSVGRPKHGDPCALYCHLNLGRQLDVEFVRVPYKKDEVAQAILAEGLPPSFAKLILTGKES